MNEYAALAVVYPMACFVGAAVRVRLHPRSRVSVLLRRHLALMLLLPVFVAIDALALILLPPRLVLRGLRRLFERLSGHRTYVRRESYYSYFSGSYK